MALEGSIVRLRPSKGSDRRAIFEWLAASDVTASMIGPPLFPEVPVPTWEEFVDDYGPGFFDGSNAGVEGSFVIEVDGEPVGQVNYEVIHPAVAELDIWLRSEADTGRGYGPDALDTLVRHLHETLGTTEFIIRPSARNPRAVRAYEKAGFKRLGLTQQQQAELYGPGDYPDTVVLRRTLTG